MKTRIHNQYPKPILQCRRQKKIAACELSPATRCGTMFTLFLCVVLTSSTRAADQFVRVPNLPTSATYSFGCAWGDYDNDGFIDLIVANGGANGRQAMDLYHNNKDGNFARMTTNEVGTIVSDKEQWGCVAWGDANNDGFLDLLAAGGWSSSENPRLYLNDGKGSFRSVSAGDLTGIRHFSGTANWADYDGDGFLDVFMSTGDPSRKVFNMLFHAKGDGTFALVKEGPIVTDLFTENSAVWADFDNDKDPDLFVTNYQNRPDYFYRNDGGGKFTRITSGLLVNSPGNTVNPAWGDYNNDGFLDLVLTKDGRPLLLGNESGVFVKGPVLPASAASGAPAWLDYDNDGYLDLYFVHGQGSSLKNVLAHNNGDGTFTSVTNALTSDFGAWDCPAIGDFDNDGFPDVFITASNGKSALYRNLRNGNHWIKFQLKGTASNAAALGAKVRVKATIGGKTFWQMREITSGTYSQDDLRPNFGLGDATVVETVRIEWPSGNVQELTDIAPDQILIVKEPLLIDPANPSVSLGGEITLTNKTTGKYQWRFNGVDLINSTNRVLKLTNLQSTNAGSYSVAVVTTAGAVITNFVYLKVDPTFTKITEGPVVTNREGSTAGAWGDYDNDGLLDLFVSNSLWLNGGARNSLYHNLGGDEFVRVTNAITSRIDVSWHGQWADYDNDGDLDLFVPHANFGKNELFRNDGGGVFTPVADEVTATRGYHTDASWIDHDGDGRLDLFVSTQELNGNRSQINDFFFRNLGDGTFKAWTTNEVGAVVHDHASTYGIAWCDYDNDGKVDLYVVSNTGGGFLYHNAGSGRIELATAGSLPGKSATASAVWGDFNNDGLFDLFTTSDGGTNTFHLNQGNGQFVDATVASGLAWKGTSYESTAGDFDNDGDLDL